MRLDKMHINYKNYQKIFDMAKQNGIKTFGELEMYCRVWDIENLYQLEGRLSLDCFYLVYNKGVSAIGNN